MIMKSVMILLASQIDLLPQQVFASPITFVPESTLAPFKKNLPTVSDPKINEILHSDDTVWYDRDSMVYVYQDSQETVVGLRENKVGWDVGNRNRSNPQIAKLMNYFDPEGFKSPYDKGAGMARTKNVKVYTLWSAPKTGDKFVPVKYWRKTSRSRWNWIFPIDTHFMEMMFQQSPSGEWIPFEIRTRRRYEKGWESNIFRPFPTRESLNAKIQSSYPSWNSHPDLTTLVSHLNNTETLVREDIETKPYTKLVPKITGFVDYLPEFSDSKIIDELLLSTTFTSSMDKEWKRSENGSVAYGATSISGYHISPEGTLSGLFAVNEKSCNVCHTDTAKHLGILETDITLYGEMWGEDEAFSWHLFQPNSHIYGTWDDVDVSRVVNKTLITAGLLINSEVRGPELHYHPIKR